MISGFHASNILIAVAIVALSACRTTTPSSVKDDETGRRPPSNSSTVSFPRDTLKDYDPGKLETIRHSLIVCVVAEANLAGIKNLTMSEN